MNESSILFRGQRFGQLSPVHDFRIGNRVLGSRSTLQYRFLQAVFLSRPVRHLSKREQAQISILDEADRLGKQLFSVVNEFGRMYSMGQLASLRQTGSCTYELNPRCYQIWPETRKTHNPRTVSLKNLKEEAFKASLAGARIVQSVLCFEQAALSCG